MAQMQQHFSVLLSIQGPACELNDSWLLGQLRFFCPTQTGSS